MSAKNGGGSRKTLHNTPSTIYNHTLGYNGLTNQKYYDIRFGENMVWIVIFQGKIFNGS